MKSKHYTVVILSSHQPGMRTVKINWWFLAAIGATILAIFTLLALVSAHCIRLAGETAQGRVWREENLRLKEDWIQTQNRIDHLAEILDRVENSHERLKNVSTPSLPPSDPLSPPVPKPNSTGALSTHPPTGLSQQDSLSRLSTWALAQKTSMDHVEKYFTQQNNLLAASPSTWPVRGWVTSDYGFRLNPFTAERMLHRGIDIAASHGTPITAPSNGTVLFAGSENGYGKALILKHDDGMQSRYAHLSSIDVHLGQKVLQGEKLGAVGNTGRSTGPHLHYEVLVDGIARNPRLFILQ